MSAMSSVNSTYFTRERFWCSLASYIFSRASSTRFLVVKISSDMMSSSAPCFSVISAMSFIIPLTCVIDLSNSWRSLSFSLFRERSI